MPFVLIILTPQLKCLFLRNQSITGAISRKFYYCYIFIRDGKIFAVLPEQIVFIVANNSELPVHLACGFHLHTAEKHVK